MRLVHLVTALNKFPRSGANSVELIIRDDMTFAAMPIAKSVDKQRRRKPVIIINNIGVMSLLGLKSKLTQDSRNRIVAHLVRGYYAAPLTKLWLALPILSIGEL